MGSFYPVIKTIDETRRRFVVLNTFYVDVFQSITIITIITIIVTVFGLPIHQDCYYHYHHQY